MRSYRRVKSLSTRRFVAGESRTPDRRTFEDLPILRLGLQGIQISPRAILPGIGVAALLALIVGMPPALGAMRLNIVDALADKR